MKTFIVYGSVSDVAAILKRLAVENKGVTVIDYMNKLNKDNLILKAW